MVKSGKYDDQRQPVHPPVVRIGHLRSVAGLTLDQLCERVGEITGKPPTRGAMSAIEHGIRGASDEMLRAIALAFGLPPDAIDTTYVPRAGKGEAA
jgi:transcriptional regulator with XRE-family HTH domain